MLRVGSTLVRPAGENRDTEAGLWTAFAGDGRPLLAAGSLALLASGLFAWFLAATNQLLPHDLDWLTIPEAELRAVADGRLVHFMSHDRGAFGGTLISIGVLYLWLIRFPLGAAQPWAWWVLAGSAGVGFLTFMSYLATGYLDSWHGQATLAILPLFVIGLWRTRGAVAGASARLTRRRLRGLLVPPPAASDRELVGRALLLLTGFGMLVAGLTIVTIGSLVVFVPQDLEYIGLTRADLAAIDPRLVPLVAHDRAGFGGALATTGLVVIAIVRFAEPTRALWQALAVAGAAGFGAAVGVHGLVGYLDGTHVGPAILAAILFAAGMALWRPRAGDAPRPDQAGVTSASAVP